MTSTTTADYPATYNDDTNQAKPYHTDHGTAVRWAADLGHKPLQRDPRHVRNLLDAPSDPNPLLDALMHNALLGIYLRADGGTAKFDQAGKGRGKPGGSSRAPVSGLWADLEALERAYRQSRTHRHRLLVIREAQQLVVAHSKTDPSQVRNTPEWRLRIARDPRPRRQIAKDYCVSSKTITAIRKEYA